MPYFDLYKAGRKLNEVPIEGLEAVVGRDPRAEVHVPGPSVSRQHARVYVRDGAWVVEDLGTRNGTWVNGKREFVRPLQEGDRIQLDDFVLVFHRPEGEALPVALPKFQTRRQRRQAEAHARGRRVETDERTRPGASVPPPAAAEGTRYVDRRQLVRHHLTALAMLEPHLVREDGAVAALDRECTTIGRSGDVRLEGAPRLGSAVVERRDDGSFEVRWKGLLGGVVVHGRRRRRVVLRDGDTFTVHGVKLVFHAGGAARR